MSELDPFRPTIDGPWDAPAAVHLLRRASFGASERDVRLALERGLEGTIEELFDPRGHDRALLDGIEPLLSTGALEPLQSWWLALMLAGGDPLRERMTLAWHDHFATSNAKVDDARSMHAQNRTLRTHALGDFRELLGAVAKDPAMLVWLDGNENVRGRANENFARELMELFALGIGAYDERDVQEAARAFTGWGVEKRAFVVRRDRHDGGEKTMFGQRGAFDGDRAIALVLARPECPRHIARRLIAAFVSAPVAPGTVDELADRLIAGAWSIAAAVRVLLRSKLFFSAAARRSRISSPIELVVGTLRMLELEIAPREAARAAARMGQALLRPPSVKGWTGGRAWIDAATWIERQNFAFEVAAALEGTSATMRRARESDATAAQAGARALEFWLGGVRDRVLADELEAALRGVEDASAAEAALARLVLTSPEYQLA